MSKCEHPSTAIQAKDPSATVTRILLMPARGASIAALLVTALAVSGCSGFHPAKHSSPSKQSTALSLRFMPAPLAVRAKCDRTARSVGYAIPCPLMVPKVFAGTGISGIVAPGSGTWRRWVVGTVSDLHDHLAITASPQPLHNYAKVVNGPAWYPNARVRPISWVTIKGWRMRAVFVPEETNDGSAFMHHVVLIWTVGGHTYGVGFHNTRGVRETLQLDKELAKHIELVPPD